MAPTTRPRLFALVFLGGVAWAPACGRNEVPRAAASRPAPIAEPSVSSSARPASPTAARGLVGVITVDVPARGRLVVGWRTAAEQRAVDAGVFDLKTARALLERYRVVGDVDFGSTPEVPYRIVDAPSDGAAFVVLDVDHEFWPTVFGFGQKGKVGASLVGGGPVHLAGNPPPDGRSACEGPRFRRIEVPAPGVPSSEGILPTRGPARRFCAYLPASWATAKGRRYPILYLFPGLLGDDVAFFRGDDDAATRIDRLHARGAREAILVGVDTRSPFGSSYLEDSPVSGRWDTFLANVAMPQIERELRASPHRGARAVVGQSTGGLNALSYGLRHSDRFSVIGASSPDAPDMEAWLLEPTLPGAPRRARSWIRAWTALDAAVGGPGQMRSYAADWAGPEESPSRTDHAGTSASDGAAGLRWPFDLATGVVDEAVLGRWVAKSPRGLLRDPVARARAKKDLSGRILITVGRDDEFELFAPAEAFAKELTADGVETTFVPTPGGHGHGLDRLEAAFDFALARLAP